MSSLHLQWFPGHMTKTKRQIIQDLKLVDLVAELVDARLPFSSRNPMLDEIIGPKPRILVINKAGMADEGTNARFLKWFQNRGVPAVLTDSVTGVGFKPFSELVRRVLADKIRREKERGMVNRPIKLMVVGIPNVGKSTFINRLAGRSSLKAGDRPGVTRGKQWVAVDATLDLLDTPGILWPKFEDPQTGLHLAFTGAVKDDIMDVETLGCHLMDTLAARYPAALEARYRLEVPARTAEEEGIAYGYALLEQAAQRRGFLVSGGEMDTERMAKILLDEFRGGKLGRFTLEMPQ